MVGTGSTFYSLLAERKIYEIWSMLKGKMKIPTGHLYPTVPFLLNLLYFFVPSKCLAKRFCVRGDNTAQTYVSRGFGKKEVLVRGGRSDSSVGGHSGWWRTGVNRRHF